MSSSGDDDGDLAGGQRIERDGVRIHFVRSGPRGATPLVVLHGLSANAQYFTGLLRAGLDERHDVIRVDLRGRGQSDAPEGEGRYSMQAHGEDVLAVMDAAGLDDAVLVGHSFGGLVTVWLAARHPSRIRRQVLADISGPTIQNPEIVRLLYPLLDRLDREFPSFERYLDFIRGLPFLAGVWTDELLEYLRADVADLPSGAVRPRTPRRVIDQCLQLGAREDWAGLIAQARAPALALHAPGAFGPAGAPPLVLRAQADDLVACLPDARLASVPGNHMTMMFGPGARAVVAAIDAFLSASGPPGSA
ncbi:MAG TPA: alpha/beta fold hydrolase [Kofleriaceae bacterium]|nr:alpha/beta fold hydrolase [Kofleriaceae bacterium]